MNHDPGEEDEGGRVCARALDGAGAGLFKVGQTAAPLDLSFQDVVRGGRTERDYQHSSPVEDIVDAW